VADPIVVVGAGLSGLFASHLLARAGERVMLIESRGRIGGRILSDGPPECAHRVDLGPSWFWPTMNPRLQRLAAQLGLGVYAQHSRGDSAIERPDGTVQRQRGWAQSPAPHRIEGGMQALTDGLLATLAVRVPLRLNTRLVGMALHSDALELHLEQDGAARMQRAQQVVLAMPPRLIAGSVRMHPSWPQPKLLAMQQTPTWMAGQAKFAAVYPTAFWRQAGWSGDAMSQRGPLVEIHDASDADGGTAALFGFVGASPAYRNGIGAQALARQAIAQWVRMFGEQAAAPIWQGFQDWAQDPATASPLDLRPLNEHPLYGATAVPDGWAQRLWLAGTERSKTFGGYLEGALEAAEEAVAALLARRRRPEPARAVVQTKELL
jgi:monoamine oxidase